MNKKIIGALLAAVLVFSIGIGVSFAAPNLGNSLGHRQDGAAPVMKGNLHQFKQLKLMYSTTNPDDGVDPVIWMHVPGNEISGFKLCLNETVEYYYLDVMALKPYAPIADGIYGFKLDKTLIDDWEGWEDYWTGRGVDVTGVSNPGYLQVLYDIFITCTSPVFYLNVEGGNYRLLDGFHYLVYSGEEQTLRVDGTYFLGTFTYFGVVDGQDITMQITFRTCECDECVQG